jgi:hypothetical protein
MVQKRLIRPSPFTSNRRIPNDTVFPCSMISVRHGMPNGALALARLCEPRMCIPNDTEGPTARVMARVSSASQYGEKAPILGMGRGRAGRRRRALSEYDPFDTIRSNSSPPVTCQPETVK